MHNYYYRKIMEVAADGKAGIEALAGWYEEAGDDPVDALDMANFDPYQDALLTSAGAAEDAYNFGTSPEEVRFSQCGLLREIFGNPFCSITIAPSWLTSTVQQIAETIYSERAFDRLAILADALEDAGCTSQDILSHLRQPGVHVRGCWCLDLVLEKE